MRRLEWHDGLLTGDPLVDRQHQAIYALLEELTGIVEAGGDRQRTADVLYDLLRYVGTHLADEEALMRRIGYPGLAEQCRMHERFAAEAAQMAEEFLAGRGVTSQTLLQHVVGWVHDHVAIEDLQLAEFIRTERTA